MPSSFEVRLPITVGAPPADVWGQALGRFLAHLLDGVRVELTYTRDDVAGVVPEGAAPPWSCARRLDDGWVSVLTVTLHPSAGELYRGAGPARLPPELMDFPDAAVRALDRITAASTARTPTLYPSIVDALHDVVVAEILAERVAERAGAGEEGRTSPEGVLDRAAYLVSDVLSYLAELSRSRIEGHSPTHGVVIGAHHKGLAEQAGVVRYPPDLRRLKRAPLLFDGLRAALAVGLDGLVHGELTHRSIAGLEGTPVEETLAGHGDLVAAGSRMLDGAGLFLRADGTVWAFDQGQPLLLRRGGHWHAIPFQSLAAGLGRLAGSPEVAALVVRTALLASLEGEGAILAVADDAEAVERVVEEKDRYDLARQPAGGGGPLSPEARLHQVVDAERPDVEALLRLAVIDGATIIDGSGRLITYGAVVRSGGSRAEGARTAAARSLSRHTRIVLKVSEDGPITVFHRGAELAAIL